MKFIFLAVIFTFVSCEINLSTFDWSTLKPLTEIEEWRQAHPNFEALKSAHPSRSGRILNGNIVNPTEFPYLVGIMLHFDSGNSWCGGSLISRNFVLTAANCVHIVPSTSVLLGASNINNAGELIRVASARIHPEYNFDESINDIATLELSRPVDLSTTINLVRLPNRRQVQSTFENQLASVLGWGRTSSGTQPIPTQFLRLLNAPIITNTLCRVRYPAFITNSNVCTNPTEGTPCEGDEGGPLMITEADGRRTQIGIFSYQFSLGCGLGWPAVYARVTSFLDFIEQNSDVTILETWE